MSSGQEGLMAVREERVREGGIETTNTTFVSSTDEGGATEVEINSAWGSGFFQPTQPKVGASGPADPTPIIPAVSPPSSPLVVPVARKRSCCLKRFCCLYDRDSKWYELKGKGFWCVLFLLLGYLTVGVTVGILYCIYKICCRSKARVDVQAQAHDGDVVVDVQLN